MVLLRLRLDLAVLPCSVYLAHFAVPNPLFRLCTSAFSFFADADPVPHVSQSAICNLQLTAPSAIATAVPQLDFFPPQIHLPICRTRKPASPPPKSIPI